MREDAFGDEVLRVHLPVLAAADDVHEPDRPGPDDLPGERDDEADQCRDQVIGEHARSRQEDQQARQREDVEARAVEEIAEPDHHLTAMIPQKLYHLKNTST